MNRRRKPRINRNLHQRLHHLLLRPPHIHRPMHMRLKLHPHIPHRRQRRHRHHLPRLELQPRPRIHLPKRKIPHHPHKLRRHLPQRPQHIRHPPPPLQPPQKLRPPPPAPNPSAPPPPPCNRRKISAPRSLRSPSCMAHPHNASLNCPIRISAIMFSLNLPILQYCPSPTPFPISATMIKFSALLRD